MLRVLQPKVEWRREELDIERGPFSRKLAFWPLEGAESICRRPIIPVCGREGGIRNASRRNPHLVVCHYWPSVAVFQAIVIAPIREAGVRQGVVVIVRTEA